MTTRRAFRAMIGVFLISSGASFAGEPKEKAWAFRPVVRPEIPPTIGSRHPIDAFLGRALKSDGLVAAPEADRRTVIRRLTFDIIGLPPSPEEIQAFLEDARPDAYEILVDRLLASPHYGERWGRHWLDLVRFAETHGYERDDPKPNAWKYRDWVISAMNRDMPYDRFLVEQLAGDEVEDASESSKTATGMYRLGPIDDEPADVAADRYDQLDDMIKTIGTTMLGLSVHCARCHDHKFDPIKQTDYYRMLAFLAPSKPFVRDDLDSISVSLAHDSERLRSAEMNASIDRRIAGLAPRIEAILAPHRKAVEGMTGDLNALALARLSPSELALKTDLDTQVKNLHENRPTGLPLALGLTDVGANASPSHLMIRGDAHRPGAVVEPGYLSIIDDSIASPAPSGKTTGRRLALARWITRKDNPLTARVMMNRLWQGHFGRGIVATPSDFGAMGDEPTDPELLDWLASEFVAQGWSMKAMHKLMVTSAAYRRSGEWNADAAEADPSASRLWRYPPHRLEAEPIRDAILAVSGNLNLEIGGPSIMPPIDAAVLAGQSRPGSGWTVSDPAKATKRSVYIHVKRTLGVPELDLLDAADKNDPCPKRAVTTTAPQALTFLNGAFLHEQAGRFADRLKAEAGEESARQIDRAFHLAFGRSPTIREDEISRDFLRDQIRKIEARPKPEDRRESKHEALRAFCLVILNANEFVTID